MTYFLTSLGFFSVLLLLYFGANRFSPVFPKPTKDVPKVVMELSITTNPDGHTSAKWKGTDLVRLHDDVRQQIALRHKHIMQLAREVGLMGKFTKRERRIKKARALRAGIGYYRLRDDLRAGSPKCREAYT